MHSVTGCPPNGYGPRPTLLGEIVDSARALTSARYGAVTTVDADGQLQDFVTRGTSEAEHRRLLE